MKPHRRFFLSLLLAFPGLLAAHSVPLTSTKVDLSAEGLSVEFRVAEAPTAEFPAYFLERFVLENDDERCVGSFAGQAVVAGVTTYRFTYPPVALGVLRITDNLFYERNPAQVNLATFGYLGHSQEFSFNISSRVYTIPTAELRRAWAPPPEPVWTVIGRYLLLGVEHIGLGFDHLAFLLGLLLVARSWRHVVVLVTTFTLAHTVTLVGATLGVFAVDPHWVEVLIAVSIVVVGAENLWLLRRGANSPLLRRAVLVAVFGLVHGFGFSSALRGIGLPPGQDLVALLCFNLGVELGQVALAAVVVPLLFWLRKTKVSLPLAQAASLLIGVLGLAWLGQRSFA